MKPLQTLIQEGIDQTRLFCENNSLPIPEIRALKRFKSWVRIYENSVFLGRACVGYFHPSTGITVFPRKCQKVAEQGGVNDMSVYGVIIHELGHYVDYLANRAYSLTMRKNSGEEQINSYCPNDQEWFAEMFRVFVSNPSLLEQLRPKTFQLMKANFKL